MTNRPDIDEAYMKDAIETAKQLGAVVKDIPDVQAAEEQGFAQRVRQARAVPKIGEDICR
jgi:hypothetical protein